MAGEFNLSHWEDYKVLATLFERGVADKGLADEEGLPFNFGLLKISDDLSGTTQTFDFVNGIIVDESAPADRLVDDELVVDFNTLEKAALENLDKKVLEFNESTEMTSREKFDAIFNSMAEAEEELEKNILDAEDGRHYASVFNNIGQIRLLQYDLVLHEGLKQYEGRFTLQWFEEQELKIFSVLKQAVALSLPRKITEGSWSAPGIVDDPNFILKNGYVYKVSRFQAVVLSSAYSQIAAVLLQRGSRIESLLANPKAEKILSEPLRSLLSKEKTNLEALLSEFLMISGAFGNKFAKSNATALNPWAQLCGEMVRDSLVNTFK